MYSANCYENWHNWAHSVVRISHGSRFTVCMTKMQTTALRRLDGEKRKVLIWWNYTNGKFSTLKRARIFNMTIWKNNTALSKSFYSEWITLLAPDWQRCFLVSDTTHGTQGHIFSHWRATDYCLHCCFLTSLPKWLLCSENKKQGGERKAFEEKNNFPITPINSRGHWGKMNGTRNPLKAAVQGTLRLTSLSPSSYKLD